MRKNYLLLKLDFIYKPIPARIEMANHIFNMMNGNTNFPSPQPAIDDLKAEVDKLEEASQKALSGDKYQIQVRNELAITVNNMLKQLALFVNMRADGSTAIAASSGFPLRKTRERRVVGQVLDVRTKFTGIPGEIYLSYKSATGATFYKIMMSATPEIADSWKQVALTTRTKEIITGLDTAKYYYFQVVALGASGQGEPSDIARMIAA